MSLPSTIISDWLPGTLLDTDLWMSMCRQAAGLVGTIDIGQGGLWPTLAQFDGSFWMPVRASTAAGGVDDLFYFIFWLSFVFFFGIVGVMVLFVFRYRERPGHQAEETATHSTALEVTWSVVPLVLVIIIFWWGFQGFMEMSVPPSEGREILVTAEKWKFTFTYPNGYVDGDLHVPQGENILLTLNSLDVIHSFYVPAFRLKRDVVPGRYHKAWFNATEVGEYQAYCAEYCGTAHSDMLARVIVHPAGEFDAWLREASDFISTLPPAEAGAKVFSIRGCPACHSVKSESNVGPALDGLFGRTEHLEDGVDILADENYLRESILEPMAKVVGGYEPVMPTFQGRLSEDEVTVLIAYLKSLE